VSNIDNVYRRLYESRYRTKYDELKRKYEGLDGQSFTDTPCYYCGDQATTIDHTIPLIFIHQITNEQRKIMEDKLVRVPACRECNGFLGSKVFATLEERKFYVKTRIYKKHKKDIELPDWTTEELKQLGDNMFAIVVQGLTKRNRALQRLLYDAG